MVKTRDMASALREVLEPVLAPTSAERAAEQMLSSVQIARVGCAMWQDKPSWMVELELACASYQQQLESMIAARQLSRQLRAQALPKPLQEAAVTVRKLAAKEARKAERVLLRWRESEQGTGCRVAIRQALKSGAKSRALVLADAQIDACLQRREAQHEKRRHKVLQQSTWKRIKKQGKRARELGSLQRFVCALGHHIESTENERIVARYQILCEKCQAAHWLKRLLKHETLQTDTSAAVGALWCGLRREQDQIKREQFIAAAPIAASSQHAPSAQSRPSFPLRMHFGVPVAS